MPRRFTARRATIDSDLRSILRKMKADALRVEEGMNSAKMTIAFRRGARWYTFECAKYEHIDDNYRAVHLTIDYLWRAQELYGVTREEADTMPLRERQAAYQRAEESFEALFLPFSATPGDLSKVLQLGAGNAPWWDVLAVDRNASPQVIRTAYLALTRLQHPDAGGDNETMLRINRAYDEALREVKSSAS